MNSVKLVRRSEELAIIIEPYEMGFFNTVDQALDSGLGIVRACNFTFYRDRAGVRPRGAKVSSLHFFR